MRTGSTMLLLWGAAVLAGAALAVAWGLLGFGLRAECTGETCLFGPTIDLIAAGVVIVCVVLATRFCRRAAALLAVATLVLLVPLLRSLLFA